MNDDRVAIWIPARVDSSRLDAKLLRRVGGRSLLAHTLGAARLAADALDATVAVVTDSSRIEELAFAAEVESIRVDVPCQNGSERLAHALAGRRSDQRPDLVVNLQGDEPLVPVGAIVQLVAEARARGSRLATLMVPGGSSGRSVSVVTDRRGRALYFSRAPLPGLHPQARPGALGSAEAHYGGHVGLYLYGAEVLASWLGLEPSPLELAEGLEQLRALHHGVTMDVFSWRGIDGDARNGHHLPWFAVDTQADLERFERLLG